METRIIITRSILRMVPAIVAMLSIGCCTPEKEPVDYVNPYTGSKGWVLTSTAPLVQLPNGMARVAPTITPWIHKRYLADRIYSFPAGRSWIMPVTGELELDEHEVASGFDHDFETATPYYYRVLLRDYNVDVEYTVTTHAVYYRFTFHEEGKAHILLGSDGRVEIASDRVITGVAAGNSKTFIHAEFNKPFEKRGTWNSEGLSGGPDVQVGSSAGAFAGYHTAGEEVIEVKIGISFIDTDQARRSLETEIPGWNFDRAKREARDQWNKALNKIRVEGGTEKQRTIFYTALYRALLRDGGRGTYFTEYGRYYSRFDNRVHSTDGRDFYSISSNWGCRELLPLMMILEPERQNDLIHSYVRMEEQGGWLSRHSNGMIGHHECVTILDAYRKGFTDFDLEKAFEGMKRFATSTTMLSRALGDLKANELDSIYYEKGFYPSLRPGEQEWVEQVNPGMLRQSVSITLENCQDDWALSQMAKILGRDEDYRYFLARSQNYRNVFHEGTGFMRPRAADGTWIEPFDPVWTGGLAGRDHYTESNCWNYTWYVTHDVDGLIGLMGGRERFIDKLDQLFSTTPPLFGNRSNFAFLGMHPNMTGLIGMYTHGNENTRYIPYLYNYAGAPWKTQKRVRDIMEIWYGDGPLGICGDEDGGLMSAWYVLSAVGIYQLCPGRAYHDIGSPIFEKASIDVGGGKRFVIEARKVSAQNKYIQSATLNGEPLEKPWFEHKYLADGGILILEMGPWPNKEWGSKPGDAPPGMSSDPPSGQLGQK